MTSPTLETARPAPPSRAGAAAVWLVAGLLLAFAVPFAGTDLLGLQHDLYYLIYFTTVIAFLVAFVRVNRFDVTAMVRRLWPWSLVIGALQCAGSVKNLLGDDATAHPHGAYFAFEILWRGVIYGLVDAALLSAFPAMVALLLFGWDLRGIGRKLAFAGTALALVASVTVFYHAGYEQYRNDAMQEPVIGNIMFGLPVYVVANPAGSLLSHPTVHVAAVVHEYEGDQFLPPAIVGYPERGAGWPAWLLAAAWLALTGAVVARVTREPHERRPGPGRPGTQPRPTARPRPV